MSLSAKMIDRRTCTPRGNHSYGPFFLEYSLLAEYNLLRKQKLPGVYVIPSTNSPLCKQLYGQNLYSIININNPEIFVYIITIKLCSSLQVGTA